MRVGCVKSLKHVLICVEMEGNCQNIFLLHKYSELSEYFIINLIYLFIKATIL